MPSQQQGLDLVAQLVLQLLRPLLALCLHSPAKGGEQHTREGGTCSQDACNEGQQGAQI